MAPHLEVICLGRPYQGGTAPNVIVTEITWTQKPFNHSKMVIGGGAQRGFSGLILNIPDFCSPKKQVDKFSKSYLLMRRKNKLKYSWLQRFVIIIHLLVCLTWTSNVGMSLKNAKKKNHEILMNIICVLPYPISLVHLRKQQNTAV